MAVENLAAMAEIGKASPFVKEQVTLVKYLIMGHNTYINRLMNKSAHLVRDSDDAYESNTILQFFMLQWMMSLNTCRNNLCT
jgi:hypothetical protein